MKRRSKTHARRGNILPFFLVGIGILFIGAWLVHRLFYARSLSLSDSLISAYSAERGFTPLPRTIEIPGNPTLRIVEAGKINGIWTISDTAANHVRQSAAPGQEGNIIIYGHNTRNVFGNLTKTAAGTIITVTATDNTKHRYQVVSVSTVSTDQTELLQPRPSETLTVYTCTGWLDSKRFVVRAVPAH